VNTEHFVMSLQKMSNLVNWKRILPYGKLELKALNLQFDKPRWLKNMMNLRMLWFSASATFTF